jgi:hypothetical protein
MPKKRTQTNLEPLPSALTVANPQAYKKAGTTPKAVTPPATRASDEKEPARPPKTKRARAKSMKGVCTDGAADQAPLPKPPETPAPQPVTTTPDREQAAVTLRTVEVRFTLFEPSARDVALCGSFNGWRTATGSMHRTEDGHWEATLSLAPGRYEYKFVVDGQWIPDPHASENVLNEFGTLNSVLQVRLPGQS